MDNKKEGIVITSFSAPSSTAQQLFADPIREYMPVSILENRAMRRERQKEERMAQRRK